MKSSAVVVGPVYPYRGGVSYCTVKLAEELGAEVISFKRQFPKSLYPGGDDIDKTLTPYDARFLLDIMNPFTWIRAGLLLRRMRPQAVVFVWYVWIWAPTFFALFALLPKKTRVILQCHNINEKEPAAWKRWITTRVLRRGDVLVVHAKTEHQEAVRRVRGRRPVVQTFLPVHELGGEIPPKTEARRRLGLHGHVALFFGHVRPFKGLDIALQAWRLVETEVTLVVAGQAWWKSENEYRAIAEGLPNVRFDFRFIPDAEVATYFAATDVVLAPYRVEAQSGVALTSFHFARPVIAAAVGGLPELIEHGRNGLLIPPEDPAALAAAVDAIFTTCDRAAMERHAAASARKYTWEEYGALFRRLVAGE